MAQGVTEELVRLVERVAHAHPPPAVRALHLPPSFAQGSKEGEFCALELDDGSIGLSYVLLGDTLAHLLARRPGAALAGVAALELARGYARADPLERTLGFAAINAITQWLYRRAGYVPPGAADSLGGLDPRPGDRVGMVGWFGGLAKRIVAAGARLVVVELDPALAGEKDGYVVTLDAGELAHCDKLLSTTTLLLNDTLDDVLARARRARTIALIGPGGGCLPDPLFARGVTLLGGTAVTDRDGFVAALSEGRAWGPYARKTAIARDGWPGADALLARLRAGDRGDAPG